jgi:uncharacterized membrane protein
MILVTLEDWMILFGRTHPLIVHLPIGILFIGVVLECISLLPRYSQFRPALPLVWFLSALTSVLSCVAGLMLSQEGGFDDDTLRWHQWLGIMVAVLCSGMFVLRVFIKPRTPHITTTGALLSFITISVTGHFGGTLTHGDDYLTTAFYTVPGNEDDDQSSVGVKRREPIVDVEKALVYGDLVEPVLEQKCVRCHGSKKQKGKLRLDQYELILVGGKSGSTIAPGNAGESEMYKRLLLPADDKKRMPPRGKPQLTDDEKSLIRWWIEEGNATTDKKVSDVKKTEPIRLVLAGLTTPQETSVKADPEIPEDTVADASESDIAALRSAGLVVSKYSADLPYLTVNCVNAPGFNDELSGLLLPLKDQIIWLKAGNTKVTDTGLKNIGKLHNLTRLSLEFTSVTDKGLRSLKDLSRLRYLNLVGNKISPAGVRVIGECSNLRSVYLWQTGLAENDLKDLRAKLPMADINTGER